MENEFEVECSVCKTRYQNHIGSTECCGALAFLVENNEATDKATIYAVTPEAGLKSTTIIISDK